MIGSIVPTSSGAASSDRDKVCRKCLPIPFTPSTLQALAEGLDYGLGLALSGDVRQRVHELIRLGALNI
jgi:hypothetical protein